MFERVIEKAVADFLQRVAASDQHRQRGLMLLQQCAEQCSAIFKATIDRGVLVPAAFATARIVRVFCPPAVQSFWAAFRTRVSSSGSACRGTDFFLRSAKISR